MVNVNHLRAVPVKREASVGQCPPVCSSVHWQAMNTGTSISSKLVEITKEGTTCTAFQECADLLADGEDIDYDGVSGPVEFSDAGDPTQATIGIYQYGPDNTYTNVDYFEGQI